MPASVQHSPPWVCAENLGPIFTHHTPKVVARPAPGCQAYAFKSGVDLFLLVQVTTGSNHWAVRFCQRGHVSPESSYPNLGISVTVSPHFYLLLFWLSQTFFALNPNLWGHGGLLPLRLLASALCWRLAVAAADGTRGGSEVPLSASAARRDEEGWGDGPFESIGWFTFLFLWILVRDSVPAVQFLCHIVSEAESWCSIENGATGTRNMLISSLWRGKLPTNDFALDLVRRCNNFFARGTNCWNFCQRTRRQLSPARCVAAFPLGTLKDHGTVLSVFKWAWYEWETN